MCMNEERDFYFNLPEVQKALHANRTNLPYSWIVCTKYVDSVLSERSLNLYLLAFLAKLLGLLQSIYS